jgi:large subunit ribosomal protein L19e
VRLSRIKKIASELLKVGVTRIWINPEEESKVKEAMTKEDVRELIKNGVIKKKKLKEQSRGRARILHEKKRKGRKRGRGKRKGTRKARVKRKEFWVKNVRAQRKKLKELKLKGLVKGKDYGEIYRKIKGNYFKGKKYVELAVKALRKGK